MKKTTKKINRMIIDLLTCGMILSSELILATEEVKEINNIVKSCKNNYWPDEIQIPIGYSASFWPDEIQVPVGHSYHFTHTEEIKEANNIVKSCRNNYWPDEIQAPIGPSIFWPDEIQAPIGHSYHSTH